MKSSFLKLLLLSCFASELLAGNIQVNNARFTGKDTAANIVYVTFDISWDMSWRRDSMGGRPRNWDAAWVFVKFRRNPVANVWEHMIFPFVDGTGTGDGHIPAAGSVIRCSNDNGAGGSFGVFIYGNRNFEPQTVNYTNVRLRWNYASQGVADWDSLEICVFAIEMVYIPQGAFYAGASVTTGMYAQFEAGNTNTSFLITSENALTLGGTSPSNLSNHNRIGQHSWFIDDFNYSTTQTLPAAYPKGFRGFYIMKYEITQEQYAAFLNKLTNLQHGNRFPNVNAFRHAIQGTWPNYFSTNPYVACNYLGSNDIAAYLDWAALRPMSELEYEKACRAPFPSLYSNDFAWGDTYILGATGITNPGATNERPTNIDANCCYNNHTSVQGPMRSGAFGENKRRNDSLGASYWGVFELSGNVAETVISLGNATGRSFTGNHGDGNLNTVGDANTGWGGFGIRGGSWYDGIDLVRIAQRYLSNYTSGTTRQYYIGGRGVRNLHPVLP